MSHDPRMEERNYWNDPRVQAQLKNAPYAVVEHGRDSAKVVLNECFLEQLQESELLPEDHDGKMELPSKYEVCDLCSGSGKVVNPSIDCCGLTQEDFDEDPDFEENYRSGRFDITCPECGGLRVIPTPTFPPEIQEEINSWWRSEADYARETAAERAMGA